MRYRVMLVLPLLALAVAGCGGGSSSGGATHALGVFATDSFNDEYDHVWTTIYKVELVTSSGATVTAFSDPNGRLVDPKTLRDSSGARFLFLNDAFASAATYTAVRVTIGSSLVLFPTGSSAGQEVPLADALPRDSQGHVVIEFALANPRNLASGSDDLVIDFDLAHFVLTGGKLTPALKEGDRTGLQDRSRHEEDEYTGTVSDLSGTAPNLTFTLTTGSGMSFAVATSGTTESEAEGEGAAPALANGTTVEVEGSFDVATNRLVAKEIQIKETGASMDGAQVMGVASAADAVAGTFVLTTAEVDGFMPMHATVTVATTASTTFRSKDGLSISASDCFAQLTGSQGVKVEGTYDAATNTLTAVRVRLED